VRVRQAGLPNPHGLGVIDVVAAMDEEEAKTSGATMITTANPFVCVEYYGAHQQVITYKDGSIESSGWYDIASAKRWATENNCKFIDRSIGNAKADRREFNERFKPQGLLFRQ